MMRLLGFYEELKIGRAVSTGSIFSAVNQKGGERRGETAAYLNSGATLFDSMEASPDVIGKKGYILAGSSILTDGVWIWRNDLAYYVERYNIALDDDFLQHIAASSYTCPSVPLERCIELVHELRPLMNSRS